MRVYELAKKYGISTKDFMSLLKKNGLEVASHMVVATDALCEAVSKIIHPPVDAVASDVKAKNVVARDKAPAAIVHKIEESKSKPEVLRPVDSGERKKKLITLSSTTTEDTGLHKEYIAEHDESSDLLKYQIDAQIGDGRLTIPVKGHELVDKFLQKGSDGRGTRRGGRRRRRARVVLESVEPVAVEQVTIDRDLQLADVAIMLGKSVSEVILALLKKGTAYNKNNILPIDVIEQLALGFGIQVERVRKSDRATDNAADRRAAVAVSTTSRPRYPVVVVMGHVDHGKTTLLDYIRHMNVAGGERGGITQHLGAYEVDSAHGKVIFLDTPGHEAFSYIRQRGSRITDMAILVVAADDGVKPQTIEAIKHAQAAEVPIVVAINKIDKVSSPAALETIKRQLAQHGLMPEDWGGTVVCVPISAKTGQGVDTLLEMIVLQSQLMDLHEEPGAQTKAFVLESHQERGLGAVATVICSTGTLKVGDYFICGESSGKIRVLVDSHGKRVQRVGVSIPVRVVGFDLFVTMGDWLEVVTREQYLGAKNSKGDRLTDQRGDSAARSFFSAEKETGKKGRVINLVVKTDTRGSLEAFMSSIEGLVKKHKKIGCPINVLSSGIGDITESDLEFALSTGAELVGLHVRVEKNAVLLAKDKEKKIHLYGIIYQLIDSLEKMLLAKREVIKTWNKVGKAVVRKVFDIKGLGVIAGCYLQEGVISRTCKVECVRGGVVIAESKITSLQRDKKHVKEVHAGFECGFIAETFSDWQEDDEVICYIEVIHEPAS